MAIDLQKLTPHKVSRDLSGYITYIYGAPKVGKTSLGADMPKPLLLAFERGYNALAGIIAQDISSWSENRPYCAECLLCCLVATAPPHKVCAPDHAD